MSFVERFHSISLSTLQHKLNDLLNFIAKKNLHILVKCDSAWQQEREECQALHISDTYNII